MSESNKLYLGTMFFGATVMGGTALFAKLIDLNVVSIIFWRSVVAFVLIAGLYFLNKNRTSLTKDLKVTGAIFITGLALGAHWLTYFHSIKISTVAVGAISMHTYPIFTVLLEPFVNKAKLHGRDLLLALAVFVGCVVLAAGPSAGESTLWGVIWGVLSAVLFAVRNVISKLFVSGFGALAVMLVQLSGVLVVVAVSSPFIDPIASEIPSDKVLLLVILGVFFTALPHSLVVFSLKGLSAKTASIIGCLQPIIATFFAFFLLTEVPGLNVLVGGLIITVAIIVELKLIKNES